MVSSMEHKAKMEQCVKAFYSDSASTSRSQITESVVIQTMLDDRKVNKSNFGELSLPVRLCT